MDLFIESIQNDFLIAAIILGILALALLIRVAKGPHVVDRVAAADCIDVICAFIMVLFGCFMKVDLGAKVDFYMDLGLVLALVGFVGTVLISRYLEGKL